MRIKNCPKCGKKSEKDLRPLTIQYKEMLKEVIKNLRRTMEPSVLVTYCSRFKNCWDQNDGGCMFARLCGSCMVWEIAKRVEFYEKAKSVLEKLLEERRIK